MKVVFLEDVPGTAGIGEIKEVKAGFARNYLLPRRLAAPATPALVKSAEARAVKESRLQSARDDDARALAGRLEGSAYRIEVKAGPSGKLFGSVSTADIADRVGETLGRPFERHDVVLPDSIKELGDYQVPVRLTKNVNATVSVSVVGEDGTTAADIKARAERSPGAERRPQPPEDETAVPETVESDDLSDDETIGEEDEV